MALRLLRQSFSEGAEDESHSHSDVPKGTGGNEMNRMRIFFASGQGPFG